MSVRLYMHHATSEENFQDQLDAIQNIVANSEEWMRKIWAIEGVELQVFNTSSTNILYRILEDGYGLQNQLWKDEITFPTFYVDTRVEGASESKLKVVDKIDKLIFNRDYRIISIVAKKDKQS